MRLSIWPAAAHPFADVVRIARHAEELGWDGVWIADHFMPNDGTLPMDTPVLEAGSTLAALATAVPRVRIGSLVYGNTYRHPAVVANMAATVDEISGGRFTLGMGAGWQLNEHDQYGIPLPPVRERIDRFEEALQVIRSLLTRPRTTFEGVHYQLRDALCEPKPVQDPLPILVGASGEKRMLPLVARHADQWNCWGLPDLVRHKSAIVDEQCAAIGRDPAEILRTAQAVVLVGPDAAERAARMTKPAIGGPPERLAELAAGYAAIGLDELVVPTAGLGGPGEVDAVLAAVDLLTEHVLPAVR
jgi:F420-dependent oxidoreductase-like protein